MGDGTEARTVGGGDRGEGMSENCILPGCGKEQTTGYVVCAPHLAEKKAGAWTWCNKGMCMHRVAKQGDTCADHGGKDFEPPLPPPPPAGEAGPDRIEAGTRVRVEGLHPEDSYSEIDRLRVGVLGAEATAYRKGLTREGEYYTGWIKLDALPEGFLSEECLFQRGVRVSVLPPPGERPGEKAAYPAWVPGHCTLTTGQYGPGPFAGTWWAEIKGGPNSAATGKTEADAIEMLRRNLVDAGKLSPAPNATTTSQPPPMPKKQTPKPTAAALRAAAKEGEEIAKGLKAKKPGAARVPPGKAEKRVCATGCGRPVGDPASFAMNGVTCAPCWEEYRDLGGTGGPWNTWAAAKKKEREVRRKCGGSGCENDPLPGGKYCNTSWHVAVSDCARLGCSGRRRSDHHLCDSCYEKLDAANEIGRAHV